MTFKLTLKKRIFFNYLLFAFIFVTMEINLNDKKSNLFL